MSGFWRCVVYAVVLALAAHPLGQALPRRFHPERPPFRPWKWEKNGRIYSRLGIEKWPEQIPGKSALPRINQYKPILQLLQRLLGHMEMLDFDILHQSRSGRHQLDSIGETAHLILLAASGAHELLHTEHMGI